MNGSGCRPWTLLGLLLAAPLAAETATLRVDYKLEGMLADFPPSECSHTPPRGYDRYVGELTGNLDELARDQQIVYRGVVRRTTDIGVCDLTEEDANGVRNFCNIQLVGSGDFDAELTVYKDRTEVYFQVEPRPRTVHVSAANQGCPAELPPELEEYYRTRGEGYEHWIGPKLYGPRDRVGAPLREGTYPEPPPIPPSSNLRATMVVGPPELLEADAGGPYRVVRGRKVRLDGTRSTGRIQHYNWTLTAQPCPEFHHTLGRTTPSVLTKEGATIELVALCPFKAKLTVSDGTGFDDDEVLVEIVPRTWTTKTGTPERGVYTGNFLLWPCLFCQWGKNLCAEEYPGMVEDVGHQIHRPIASRSWEGGPKGYDIRPVRDPGMLFDGWFYVESQRLEMMRAELVHVDLEPGGCISRRNTAGDFATLRAAVAEHEHQHTLDLEQELARVDPTKEIETYVAGPSERDLLRDEVDSAIAIADGRLGDRVPKDDVVHAAMAAMPQFATNGRIFLPTSAPVGSDPAECAELEFRLHAIPSYAGMGHSTSSSPP